MLFIVIAFQTIYTNKALFRRVCCVCISIILAFQMSVVFVLSIEQLSLDAMQVQCGRNMIFGMAGWLRFGQSQPIPSSLQFQNTPFPPFQTKLAIRSAWMAVDDSQLHHKCMHHARSRGLSILMVFLMKNYDISQTLFIRGCWLHTVELKYPKYGGRRDFLMRIIYIHIVLTTTDDAAFDLLRPMRASLNVSHSILILFSFH